MSGTDNTKPAVTPICVWRGSHLTGERLLYSYGMTLEKVVKFA